MLTLINVVLLLCAGAAMLGVMIGRASKKPAAPPTLTSEHLDEGAGIL